MLFHKIPELIKEIRLGNLIILMDDAKRENEGDFVMAAKYVKPEHINFMISHGKGLLCMPITKKRCKQLNLPLMTMNSNNKFNTNFTVSIESSKGITTGISAFDRFVTIQAAIKKNAKPKDIIQPGHIFPIMAKNGGVFSRAGHTEASCDLVRLAGFEPSAVLIEILSKNGHMARYPELRKISKKFNIKIGTISDLIQYRIKNENTMKCIFQNQLKTKWGIFKLKCYLDKIHNIFHIVLLKGKVLKEKTYPIKIYYQNTINDIISIMHSQNKNLYKNVESFSNRSYGIIFIIGDEKKSKQDIIKNLQFFIKNIKFPIELNSNYQKNISIVRILYQLGIKKIHLLNNKENFSFFSNFGISIQ